jgi:uncharacterized protein YsxB (DUF464 family)
MIKVQAGGRDGRFSLYVDGHAGAAPKGQDLVCAAASMLAQTALQEAVNYAVQYDDNEFCILNAEMGDGMLRLETEAVGTAAQDWRAAMNLIATGFEMLTNSHPDHINFSWVENEKTVC